MGVRRVRDVWFYLFSFSRSRQVEKMGYLEFALRAHLGVVS